MVGIRDSRHIDSPEWLLLCNGAKPELSINKAAKPVPLLPLGQHRDLVEGLQHQEIKHTVHIMISVQQYGGKRGRREMNRWLMLPENKVVNMDSLTRLEGWQLEGIYISYQGPHAYAGLHASQHWSTAVCTGTPPQNGGRALVVHIVVSYYLYTTPHHTLHLELTQATFPGLGSRLGYT